MSPEHFVWQMADEWRERATWLRGYEADPQAATHERLADEANKRVKAYFDEALTLGEAADESGYDPAHLGRLVRQGTIPNAGTEEGKIRIRRRDLPRKPGCSWADPENADLLEGASRAEVAGAVLENHKESDDE